MLNKLYIFLVLLLSVAYPQTYLTETFSKFLIDTSATHTWIFDSTFHADTDGKAVTADLGSGTAITLTANGSPALNVTGSPIYDGGKVFKSDGTDDHFWVAAAGAGDLNLSDNDFTIAFFFKIHTDPAANIYIINKRAGTPYYNITQRASDDNLLIELRDASTQKIGAFGALDFTSWYYIAVVRTSTPGDSVVRVYLNGASVGTPIDVTGHGTLDNANNFAICVFGGNAGTSSSYPLSIAQVVVHKDAWSAKKIKEEGYLADGWATYGNDVPGITRSSFAFHQGIIADTVYYNTAITADRWKITVNVDGAAGGESLKVLTSADKSTWSTIGTITATTTATNYSVIGTGLGYIGFGLTSGTVYIDDVTVEKSIDTPIRKNDRIHKKTRTFKEFRK